ncbi:MAG: sulfite exporter TauE/SafE family protein [Spirochaetota bacterium]
MPWWGWPIILFVFTFLLGIVAVLGGVGGGVLFVPMVTSFFPFHIDFVRGAGLLVALAGALSASPSLIRKGLANFRLALPAALIASVSSIAGAIVGLALPGNVVQLALGISIFGIAMIMIVTKRSEYPDVKKGNPLTKILSIGSSYHEHAEERTVEWTVHRTRRGFLLFVLIGFLAGMFGLGAGWANVPVLNLIMGAPLKVAVGTSMFILSITDTTAAWVYLNRGAILPMLAVPSIIGMMLGAKVGAYLLPKVNAKVVRGIVIVMLIAAGVRSMLKGIGI